MSVKEKKKTALTILMTADTLGGVWVLNGAAVMISWHKIALRIALREV